VNAALDGINGFHGCNEIARADCIGRKNFIYDTLCQIGPRPHMPDMRRSKFTDHGTNCIRIRQVDLLEYRLVRRVLWRLLVNTEYRMTITLGGLDEIRADKSGAAGYQNTHDEGASA
jgi:hypothetical protein